MAEAVKQRNQSVDTLRGIAILMVVFAHTMTGCTIGAERSFVYNIIWSITIPLFFSLSGFVTKFGKRITTPAILLKAIIQRTISYLLPWTVWTFFIRGVLFGQTVVFNIKYIVYNLDVGYWFLIPIYIVSIISAVCDFLIVKSNKEGKTVKDIMLTLFFFGVGIIVLLAIGIFMGFSFLGIKQAIYYIPFYIAGILFGRYQEKIQSSLRLIRLLDFLAAISVIIYLVLLINFDFFYLSKGIKDIAIRMTSSVFGCISIYYFIPKLTNGGTHIFKRIAIWSGKNSLEIYLLHTLILNFFVAQQTPSFSTAIGLGLVIVNFVSTMAVALFIIEALNKNKILRKVMFGKR